jgi:hypothetical protein
MTRVELLYFDGCPNHEPLVARVRELLVERGMPDAVELVRVDSHEEALARGFLGSPSVRVDGVDVAPGAGERDEYGLKCRLYHGRAGLAGVPDDAWIIAALDGAGSAAAALARVGLDVSRAARAAQLPAADRRLFCRVLAAFAAGTPPSAADVGMWAEELGLDRAATLRTLRSADLVQLDAAVAIAVAYPFSSLPTRHHVAPEGGPEVWAMCAIDALGIPFMLHRPAVIRAVEPDGKATIEVRVDPARDTVAAHPPSAVVVAANTGAGCSAECRCPYINLFMSADRAEAYLARHAELTGETLPLGQAVAVGRLHFGGLLEPEGSGATQDA